MSREYARLPRIIRDLAAQWLMWQALRHDSRIAAM